MKDKEFTIQANENRLYRVIEVKGTKFVVAVTEYKFKTKNEAREYIASLCKINID